MSSPRVVALLGVGLVSADTPILRADDLGALRGDGIFESMHVRGGRAWLVDEHLARMARSAATMDLALPERDQLAKLIELALAQWPAEVEGAIRLVCTRGREDAAGVNGKAAVTVFATASPVGEGPKRARHDGIAAVTASLGFPANLRQGAPWLLGGAKTISYAMNMASQRWAQSLGADDVVWVSADGYVLEAPTSSIVWLESTTLCTVPVEHTGILAGTTARWLLDHADGVGCTAVEKMITPAGLVRTDGAWLLSSVRGVAGIRSLDGSDLPYSAEVTGRLRDLLGYA